MADWPRRFHRSVRWAASAPPQLLVGRGIDHVALGVDMAPLGQEMPRHGGDAVHRTIAVECRRVVAAALPRPRLRTSAALVAGLGGPRHGERSSDCHTRENRQAAASFLARFFRKFGYRKGQGERRQNAGSNKMGLRLGANMAALVIGLAAALPAVAADPTADQFNAKVQGLAGKLAASGAAPDLGTGDLKAEIQGFLDKLSATTNGVVQWDGSDSFDFRQEGAAVLGIITNARFSIHEPQVSRVVFDRVEIRRDPVPDGSGAVKLAMVFPKQSTLTLEDGTETNFSLKDATASAIVEEPSSRVRETALSFAGARLEHKATGDWMSFGPLTFSSKLEGKADGGWATPIDFELKQIEFFLTEVPLGGAIDRIAYSASSAGPDLAALNRLRDRVDALRQEGEQTATARVNAVLDLLPTVPTLFSLLKGETNVEGVAVRAATGEPLVGLAKFAFGGALTGLSGDSAALRITLRQDGLTLAAAILDPSKVPHTVVIDFGVESVATAPLRTIIEAAAKFRDGASDGNSQQATQRMLGAAAMLTPVFRIYQLSLATQDVSVEASAEAKGSPLSPKGYTAEGDVTVRGFDALPNLVGDAPLADYLPLLKVLGTSGGGSEVKFHLASAPQKWITLNGNDISGWLASDEAGQPRALRPALPPAEGNDVRAVQ